MAIEVEGKTESRNSSEESRVKRRECVMLSSGSKVLTPVPPDILIKGEYN